jgi:tetratricopeptide (TPR) repeat protein
VPSAARLIAERSSARDHGWGLRHLERSIELYSSRPTAPGAIGAQLDLGTWLKNRGRFGEADATFGRAMAAARSVGDLPGQMAIRLAVGILRGTQRHEALAARDSTTAARLAASARYHLGGARRAARFLALTEDELRAVTALVALELDRSLRRWRWAVADELLDEAEELARVSPEPDQRWNVASMRGDWLNKLGRSEEALALLTQAAENARRIPFVFAALRERAQVHLAMNDAEAAEADLLRAIALAPAGPHRESARSILATIAARR